MPWDLQAEREEQTFWVEVELAELERLPQTRDNLERMAAALERLPHTWDNLELVFHRLWGQARAGEYRKREWAVAQAMLQTRRGNR
jgi:hypothetical protein